MKPAAKFMSFLKHQTIALLARAACSPAVRRRVKFVFFGSKPMLTAFIFCVAGITVVTAQPGWKTLRDNVPPAVSGLVPTGPLPTSTNLLLAIGLPLQNEAALDELLSQLYDPQSTNYHKYLTPAEFTARFGPTETDYAAVKKFAITNGFIITGTHPNRVVLDVRASAGDIDRAFRITLRTYRHPHEARAFFAPDVAPSVAAALPILHISGLDNYSLRRPMSVVRPLTTATAQAVPHAGSGSSGSYMGNDFRAAYAPGTTLTGSGQSVALLQFDGYYASDIANYINLAGLGNYPITLTNVAVSGGVAVPGGNNVEVCLDIEMAISMAPGAAKIIVYEAPNPSPWSTILSRIATDNLAKQISCSWGNQYLSSPDLTSEAIFKQMAAQGQSFFNASGDSDAFVGGVPFPSESTNITQVGGTTLNTTGPGGAWAGETAWNRGGGVGTSGGVSVNFGIPVWQKGISMTDNHGSTTQRNVPDVALTGENIYVTYDNGGAAFVGGTSCAAPLWAGFMALVNQQAAASGQAAVGFINPAVYAIGKSSIYNACFNDTTAGNNYNSSSPTNYPAVAGYDLCTGWGTPNGTNLINALLSPPPIFLTQPLSRNVTNGATVTFTVTVGGTAPFGYNWLFNGTNLSDSGNISGITTSLLSIFSATTNNSGNYQIVVTNITGITTGSVAILNVGFVPTVSVQPASQTNLTGSSAAFIATVGGSTPQSYRWRRSGTNISNGTVYSGVNTTNLALTSITSNTAGNYTLVATNLFGAITSSVVALTVVLPPTITSGMTNRTMECGSNVTFTIVAAGTTPLRYQWSLDGTPTPGATNASLSFTNVHLPSHLVTVVVTNLYASVTSNAVLTMNDTKAPVITLNGNNPLFLELGGAFNDPGASATDVCAGSLSVAIGGSVNSNAVGTNTLTYKAGDGNGNTNIATRNVVVRDTTPPVIVGSFTNLVLAAGVNCSATMPNVTGTNFILATDLSGAVTIFQSPANNSILPLGTNRVILTVRDASTNKAFSTNTIIVRDQAPPLIVSQPQNQTNILGTTVNFNVAATACTPLAGQWFFNTVALANQTNNSLALLSVGLTNAGNYSVVVSASGGSTTSSVATLTVNLITPGLALDSSVNPSGYKDDLSFTAAINPADAIGTVEFFTNSVSFDLKSLVAGTAISADLSSLPRGTNFVTAIYSGDASHLPVTNTIAQLITNHPPIAADVFYSYVPGFPLEIEVADLALYWTDVDGDPVSLNDFSVSTNGMVLTGSGGTLVYFNPNRIVDQFFCTISDGWDASFQTVHLVPPADPTPNITSVATRPDGSFKLDLIGAPGYTYVLQTTTNLFSSGDWLSVATNTLGTNGVWHFTDLSATNFPQQFYRLKLAP